MVTTYPRVQGVVSQQGNTLDDLINRLADAEQMPPQVMVAQAIAESDLDEQAHRLGDWPDVSFGLWQQTVAYAPIGDQSNTAANIAAVRAALYDPVQAAEIAAPQLGRFWREYGQPLETMGRYNWPARGYVGNPNARNIDRAWQASAQYVQEAPMPTTLTYAPETPAWRQRQPWTCSVNTAGWCLDALGFDVSPGQMQDEMVGAGLVNAADGLLIGSGIPLAMWLRDRFGLEVQTVRYPSWDWFWEHAGRGPIALGSTRWYHWVAVCRQAGQALALANPAPNYPPPGYGRGIGDLMGYDDFQAIAPDAAIWIPVEAAPEEDQAVIDQLTAERDALKQQVADAQNLLGYLTHDVHDAIQSALDSARVAKTKKAREAALASLQAANETLAKSVG